MRNVVISASAGVGKSTITLQALAAQHIENPRQRTLVSTPTLELAHQHAALLRKFSRDKVPVVVVEGRHPGKGEKPATCLKASTVNRIVRKGFSPRLAVCAKCGWNNDGCPYLRQFKNLPDTGIILSSHQQTVMLLLEFFQKKKVPVSTWVIDECCRDAILETRTVKIGQIQALKRHLSPRSHQTIEAMVKAAERIQALIPDQWSHGRFYATTPPHGPWEQVHDLWSVAGIAQEDVAILRRDLDFWAQLQGETSFKWTRRLLEDKVDMAALQWLWIAAQEMPGTAYIRVSLNSKNPLRFCYAENRLPDFAGRIVVLDATAHVAEAESLLRRNMVHVDAKVPLTGRKIFIRRPLGKRQAQSIKPHDIEKRLQECFKHLGATDTKVLVATHKDIEEQVLETARRLAPNRVFCCTHYGANRGLNAYEDCDAVVAFGTQTVNPASVIDAGMTLFSDAKDREGWQRWLSEAELIQTVNRIRPVYGEKTIIVMGREWPADLGEPSLTLDLMRGKDSERSGEALKRLSWALENLGFVTAQLALGLGVGGSRDAVLINVIVKSLDNHPVIHVLNQGCSFSNIIYLEKKHPSTQRYMTTLLSGYLTRPLLFSDPKFWPKLLQRLTVVHPESPRLDVRQEGTRQWSGGLGSIKAAQRFHEAAGIPFDPQYWRELPVTKAHECETAEAI